MKNPTRLKILLVTIGAGLLLGVVFSHELWFPVERTFPRPPVLFALPDGFVFAFEWTLSSILVVALLLVIFSRRPKIFLAVVVSLLILLVFFDQTRLQPWVYQYLLLLVILALRDWRAVEEDDGDESAADQTLELSQIVIAGLYIWSGLQKMNFTFSHETLPILLTPAQNLVPTFQPPFVLLGISIALFESLVGCGLLFRKTRNFAVCLAVLMHAGILTLLIAKDLNSIVWVWNAALITLVVVSFWRSSDVTAKQTFAIWKAGGGWKLKAAKLITAISVLLPLLSFFRWWDLYLSGALYSGNAPVAVMRINEDVFEKLPEKARQSVFRTKSGGEVILPFFEWATADLNVPVYPERRVFKQTARQTCLMANDKSQVELIIKERPAMFDGSYKLTRISCAQLEK